MAIAGAAFAAVALFVAGFLYRTFRGDLTAGTVGEVTAEMIYVGALLVPVGMASWCLWQAVRTPPVERLGLIAFGLSVIAVLVLPFLKAIALLAHSI